MPGYEQKAIDFLRKHFDKEYHIHEINLPHVIEQYGQNESDAFFENFFVQEMEKICEGKRLYILKNVGSLNNKQIKLLRPAWDLLMRQMSASEVFKTHNIYPILMLSTKDYFRILNTISSSGILPMELVFLTGL